MLTVIRDEVGQLQAACEWVPCDPPTIEGKWVWIEQLEVSGEAGRYIIHQLIQAIAEQMPKAEGAYWVRRNKTGSRIHWFSRTKLLREHGRLQEIC